MHHTPGLIYLVTNCVNGKKYVGQTTNTLHTRWKQHRGFAHRGSSSTLHRAIRKYGADNFTVEAVAESLSPFLDALEVMFIKLHRSRTHQHGYNIMPGGEGAPPGVIRGAAWREKQRKSHRGQVVSEATRAKLRKARANISKETRRKLSLSHLGHRGYWTDKQLSDEHRAKIGDSHAHCKPTAQGKGESGFYGVRRNGAGWTARIRHKRTYHYIGYFKKKEDAAKAVQDYIKCQGL